MGASCLFGLCLHSVAQLCPTLCDPMDLSLPGSSVHGIFLIRILEWVVISFSRGSSQPRDRTDVSCLSCAAGGFYTTEPQTKAGSAFPRVYLFPRPRASSIQRHTFGYHLEFHSVGLCIKSSNKSSRAGHCALKQSVQSRRLCRDLVV